MEIQEIMLKKFVEVFGDKENKELFFTPGRVNLIGEHIDYNGGFVFPCALSFGTYAICSKREDNIFRMYSMNFEKDGVVEFSTDKLVKADVWADYCKGIVDIFIKKGYEVKNGADILFFGNIPNGAGLSSSASLEVLMGTMVRDLNGLDVDMVEIVKIGQMAENQFIGVSCGIMDQFAVGMGKKDCAILLDCNTLKYSYSRLNMNGFKIVIGNTNKKRGLADSKYNERRDECETALKEIQAVKNITSLGELTEEEFEEVKSQIADPVRVKRAKHAVYENQRTLKAVKALENNDLKLFGKLMNASHVSLRDDYEVTGIELDTLVSLAWECEGVIGSRMTGAGFGGCTVSIVKDEYVDKFISTITPKYAEKIGYEPSFYIVEISDGTRKLD